MVKKLLITLGVLCGIVLVGVGGYAFYLYDSVKDTANQMHEPIEEDGGNSEGEEEDKPKPDVKKDGTEPISILLMGVDERTNDRGRSDTLIVMTLNPEHESMQMVSIPRDTRTEIIGRGFDDKINHAYAFGGTKMAMDTVDNFLDMNIDYYIRVNMEALEELVDAVGGITVNNDFAWSDGGVTYHEGELRLGGKEALGYVRMRKKDPDGDFGRNKRQRQVIEAIIKEGASIKSIGRFSDILAALGNNVRTNLTFDEMKDIQANYRDARHNINNYQVKGNGTYINDIYYLLVPEEEREKVSEMVKDSLEVG
jgi:LCP family protein required for cell wall assembly